ncbi:MAG: DNA gyrase subunit A [Deltaproteobacteria bacterium]|nr:MAG: DNA gyrase subunit A [Deltaproteobacteria bacterium]
MELVAEKIPVNIEEEMKTSYLDYAMSVIIGRALPDVRDGLKPVQRRILYAMKEMGNTHDKPYKKSARVVGDVIGKYHPHGDAAVYETAVRLAQDFSMRYPVIDGQGNFGSVDGDPPAAMRYTEIRMARLASELMEDIDKETVEFGPNYDDSLTEPLVLPAKIPNLLVNGSAGIAVGMATNIPPHNLGEVIDGLIALIKDPKITVEKLMKHIPGPDFPTAGFIYGRKAIKEAYNTGRGIIQLRARAILEKQKRTERESIVITEIPYQVNKSKLIERISELVREKKIEGISDLRDESDRDGMRIVIELKKDEIAQVILNQLYKHTPMQSTFGIILLALVNNQPRILNLKELLSHYLNHREEVVTLRCIYELRKAEERHHILTGLNIALEKIDEVIALIKKSPGPQEAKAGLIKKFSLSELQAQAILDMRLQRLTNLEREKIVSELKEVSALIKRLKEILASKEEIYKIIVQELLEIKEKYGDERETEIVEEEAKELSAEDYIIEEDMVVTISNEGYIKRNPISLYRSQRRGGKGKTGMTTKEEDFVESLFVASTHNYILFFTDRGRVYWLKVHVIPQAGRAAKGRPIVNLLNLAAEERITAYLPIREFTPDKFAVMVSQKGTIKKTELMAYSNPRAGGIIALSLDSGDRLRSVRITNGTQDIFLGTRNGLAIRFAETEARPMGRTAHGVKGIKLSKDDYLIGMEIIEPRATILTVTENGYGKRTEAEEYRTQKRGGKGLINIKATKRNGKVIGIIQVVDEDEIMILTNRGKIIRMKVKDISVIGRNTQGVRLIGLEAGEKAVGVARLAEKEDENNGSPQNKTE